MSARLYYKPVGDGEWQQPVPDKYRMACCDCGLVHRMQFRIYRGKVQFRAWRANRETARYRKQRHITMKKTYGRRRK